MIPILISSLSGFDGRAKDRALSTPPVKVDFLINCLRVTLVMLVLIGYVLATPHCLLPFAYCLLITPSAPNPSHTPWTNASLHLRHSRSSRRLDHSEALFPC